jgi:hypothetical protein
MDHAALGKLNPLHFIPIPRRLHQSPWTHGRLRRARLPKDLEAARNRFSLGAQKLHLFEEKALLRDVAGSLKSW